MHVILTGATGLVGSGTLVQVLANMKAGGPISRVSILSRSAVPMADGKAGVTVIRHTDFEQYPAEVLRQLEGAEACIWAQGTSQNQVGKDEYTKITLDYPLAAAKAFAGLHDAFRFIYVSGEGATQTPGRFTPIFGRVKGAAETQLLGLPGDGHASLRPFAVRPAFVDKAGQPAPMRDYLALVMGPPVRAFGRGFHSPTALLGDFFVQLAVGDGAPLEGDDVLGGGRIVPNRAFRRIMQDAAKEVDKPSTSPRS